MNEFTITFTEEELNLILASLGELPAKTSMGLIARIHQQANAGVAANQEPPAE
jgi:hypothetical protein